MKKVTKNKKSLTEYILIIALIAIVVTIILSTLGGYIKDGITKAACYIGDDTYIESSTPGDAYCKNE